MIYRLKYYDVFDQNVVIFGLRLYFVFICNERKPLPSDLWNLYYDVYPQTLYYAVFCIFQCHLVMRFRSIVVDRLP